MLGSGEDGKTLVEVWATENAWSTEADAFEDICVREVGAVRGFPSQRCGRVSLRSNFRAGVPPVEESGVRRLASPLRQPTVGFLKRKVPVPDSELATTKKRRYVIAAATLLQVQRAARVRHLDIIGIYHSHPDNCATPSEFDRLCAWHQYSYIIVSVQQGKAGDLLCWSLDRDNRFQPEEILTV